MENFGAVRKRARIAYVREVLDDHYCISMNPFIRERTRGDLAGIFGVFAHDAKDAARFLADNTGVESFNVREADNKGYMYGRGIYLAGKNGKSPEFILADVFQKRVLKTYFTLRELEQMELEMGNYDSALAMNAMKALTSTYILARAVPVALAVNTRASTLEIAA